MRKFFTAVILSILSIAAIQAQTRLVGRLISVEQQAIEVISDSTTASTVNKMLNFFICSTPLSDLSGKLYHTQTLKSINTQKAMQSQKDYTA